MKESRASAFLTFALIGALVGGLLGFLFRPSVPLVGKLPLSTVISRGSNLDGLDVFLRPAAQESFTYLFIGTLLGLLGGLVLAELMTTRTDADAAGALSSAPATLGRSPKRVERGHTLDEVTSILGPPTSEFSAGEKILHVYSNVKVTFINGRVADVE